MISNLLLMKNKLLHKGYCWNNRCQIKHYTRRDKLKISIFGLRRCKLLNKTGIVLEFKNHLKFFATTNNQGIKALYKKER